MKAYLQYSLVGEASHANAGGEELVSYTTVPYDGRLDTFEISVVCKWILFDESFNARVEIWSDRDNAATSVFTAEEVLRPLTDPGLVGSACTMAVRLRRDLLAPDRGYWIKVFRDQELVSQYPIHIEGSEDEPDPIPRRPPRVH